MSVVKSTFRSGKLINRKIVAELATIKEAVDFCNVFIDSNMKRDWMCNTKNNGWTILEPIPVPGWLMNGIEYSKVYSLKIIDSSPMNEVMSELQDRISNQ